MQVFDGKIYFGHGDIQSNAGPIPVVAYSPDSKQFETEYTAPEEQINIFKVIDGKLYIPGNDARESWAYGNYYVNDGAWQKVRTIPTCAHVLDMVYYKGKIYAAVNAESKAGKAITVMSSSDNGQTWKSEMPTSGSAFICRSAMAFNLFALKGNLYAVSSLYGNTSVLNNILKMNGTTSLTQKITSGKQFFPGIPNYTEFRMLRINQINDKLIYLGVKANNGFQWVPYGLYVATDIGNVRSVTLPEAQALPTDILIRDGITYVSAYVKVSNTQYTNIVFKSNDLVTWSEVFKFDTNTFARSFEELNGDFYFGLGCNTTPLPTSTGSIIKVPCGAF